jgi:hypothetical protein
VLVEVVGSCFCQEVHYRAGRGSRQVLSSEFQEVFNSEIDCFILKRISVPVLVTTFLLREVGYVLWSATMVCLALDDDTSHS